MPAQSARHCAFPARSHCGCRRSRARAGSGTRYLPERRAEAADRGFPTSGWDRPHHPASRSRSRRPRSMPARAQRRHPARTIRAPRRCWPEAQQPARAATPRALARAGRNGSATHGFSKDRGRVRASNEANSLARRRSSSARALRDGAPLGARGTAVIRHACRGYGVWTISRLFTGRLTFMTSA